MSSTSSRHNGRFSRSVSATLLALAVSTSIASPMAIADPAPAAAPGQDNPAEFNRDIDELLRKPIPQDVDGLLAHMREISRVTGATNEQVQQNQIDIDKAQSEVGQSQQDVEDTKRKADEALRKLDVSKDSITAVSYTHLTLPTISCGCGSRWSQYH